MGSSLILTGGAAVTKTLKEAITQTAHGFTVGDVIRWNPTSSPPKYVLAQADSAANAEVAGVVSSRTDSNNFDVTYHGYIELPNLAGISAPVMFLSSVAGGSLSSTPPSAVGTVVKPILTRNTNGSGHLVMNYLGTQIGGSSTISVDEIQPVGTIMPFAGTAIPDTWLECDGGTYTMAEYPELYNKICFTTGDRAPVYGHVVELDLDASFTGSGTAYANSVVGDYIFIKNHTVTATATSPTATPWTDETTWDTMGVIIAKGTNSSGSTGFTVQIYPKWTATGSTNTRRFVMPNVLVKTAATATISSAYRIISAADAVTDRGNGRVTTARMTAFTVPDLSGRTPIGVMRADSDSAGYEADNPYIHISTQLGPIELGAMGGEDRHQLTLAEMPAHDHSRANASDYYWLGNESNTPKDFSFSAGTNPAYELTTRRTVDSQGGNAAHNNMPPYLAVRYIIKAKSYTRAAIIDGIDLPYNDLLIRNLRTRNVGGSNGDLVFHTNTAGDSGNGTERMRLTADGKLDVRGTVSISGTGVFPTGSAAFAYNRVLVGGTGAAIFVWDDGSSVAAGRYGRIGLGSRNSQSGVTLAGGYIDGGNEGTTNHSGFLKFFTTPADGSSNIERMRITSNGSVGIGTTTPGASLDVIGTARVLFDEDNSSEGTGSLVKGLVVQNANQSSESGNQAAIHLAVANSSAFTSRISLISRMRGADSDSADFFLGSEYWHSAATSRSFKPILWATGAAGNVSIGGDEPKTRFHVVDGSLSRTVSALANRGTVLVTNSDNTRQLQIGIAHTSTSAGQVWLQGWVPGEGGSDIVLNPVSGGGNVAIGQSTITSGNKLEVAGAIRATAFNQASDRRLKENITYLNSSESLCKILNLKPCSFVFKKGGTTNMGLIADEAATVIPSAINGTADAVDSEGNPQYQGIDYPSVFTVLLSAVQELSKKLDQANERIKTLESPVK